MQLNNSCLSSVADCLGGPYLIGDLRATCSRFSRVLPKATLFFTCPYDFEMWCCKTGELAPLRHYFFEGGVYHWFDSSYRASKAGSSNVVHYMLNHLREPCNKMDGFFYGAARGGQTELLLELDAAYKSIFKSDPNMNMYAQTLYFAGRSGNYETCEAVMKLMGEPYAFNKMLLGASRGGHLELCKTAIGMGGTDIYTASREAIGKDSVEVLDYFFTKCGLQRSEKPKLTSLAIAFKSPKTLEYLESL